MMKKRYQNMDIKDVQGQQDNRNLIINRVGIKNLKFPIKLEINGNIQHLSSNISMYVNLPHFQKGTHMSRFVELIHNNNKTINYKNLQQLTSLMLQNLHATEGEINIDTTIFLNKVSPITNINGLLDYQITLKCDICNKETIYYTTINVPIASLCPCSKTISDNGAHNQRSIIKVTLKHTNELSIHDIIKDIEKCGSSELYSILKREDEKYITEYAYSNPKFVEDIVRDVAITLKEKIINPISIIIESENFESIHNHSAYAKIELK